jgi:hypothetical protein
MNGSTPSSTSNLKTRTESAGAIDMMALFLHLFLKFSLLLLRYDVRMEHEIKEIVVRPYGKSEEDFDDTADPGTVRDTLLLHRLLLEQFGNELNLIIDIIMTMDGRFDDIKDEMECRFQEEDYKFEVAFEELSELRKRRRVIRE